MDSPNKDPVLSTFFRKSHNPMDRSSLSNRDFPLHFKEKTGTQLIVQMSGQGLTAKRLTSARDGLKVTDSRESVGSGGSRGRKIIKKVEAGKLSSTHSLQINMPRQVKGKDSDDASN